MHADWGYATGTNGKIFFATNALCPRGELVELECCIPSLSLDCMVYWSLAKTRQQIGEFEEQLRALPADVPRTLATQCLRSGYASLGGCEGSTAKLQRSRSGGITDRQFVLKALTPSDTGLSAYDSPPLPPIRSVCPPLAPITEWTNQRQVYSVIHEVFDEEENRTEYQVRWVGRDEEDTDYVSAHALQNLQGGKEMLALYKEQTLNPDGMVSQISMFAGAAAKAEVLSPLSFNATPDSLCADSLCWLTCFGSLYTGSLCSDSLCCDTI